MAGLQIDAARCIGCTRCVRACATAGIEVVDRVARPTDGCVLCGACVEACPTGAISIERASESADLSRYRGIWIVTERDASAALAPVAFELAGRARQMADARGCAVVALLPVAADPGDAAARDAAEADAQALIARGCDEVLLCLDERFAAPDAGWHAAWVSGLVEQRAPEVLLIGATAWGRVLAPSIAVRLKTGLTADCTVLDIDAASGLLQQTRPAFGGNLMATIACPERRPQMATVRPGVLAAPQPDERRRGRVTFVSRDTAAQPRVICRDLTPVSSAASIASAEVLVVVGRGIGSKKNLPLMQRLADAMGAQLGCTRPLVEAGWFEYPHQVGQTGASVAPRVLLSLGVSGAIQHVAGIGGAQTIIAVNEDPAAPIFGVCHYQVVGDCVEVARQLLEVAEREGHV